MFLSLISPNGTCFLTRGRTNKTPFQKAFCNLTPQMADNMAPVAAAKDTHADVDAEDNSKKRRREPTEEDIIDAMGKRFDLFASADHCWPQITPARRELYCRTGDLWCKFCLRFVSVTFDNSGNFKKHAKTDMYVVARRISNQRYPPNACL